MLTTESIILPATIGANGIILRIWIVAITPGEGFQPETVADRIFLTTIAVERIRGRADELAGQSTDTILVTQRVGDGLVLVTQLLAVHRGGVFHRQVNVREGWMGDK